MDNLARKIHEIPGRPELVRQQTRPQKQKVAAYCRVSTDDEEQLSSYTNQIKNYTEVINANPDWELAGIFADEGITGTSMKKRDEFNKMMALCRKNKIDLILTKSISRFARNTLDSIDCVRKLKALGIGVIFEKENINTLHMSNEMVFTIMSAFAQAESESISENVRWGKRHAMKQGHVPFQYGMLGYERGEDGKPQIVPEQAAIVQRIYAGFLAGLSIGGIKNDLEQQGIPSPSGKAEWSNSVIRYILSNERYIGDALLQKSYVVDCISKQVKKNNGELAQIYIEDNHKAIIKKDTFHRVQEELARRNAKRRVSNKALSEKGRYSSKYALSELIVCGECGTRYKRVTWARKGKKKIVWRCINRLENGTQFCRNSPTLEEAQLHDAILRATNQILGVREDVLAALDDMLHAIMDGDATGYDRVLAQQRIGELNKLASDILELTKCSDTASDFFEDKLGAIYDERAKLLKELDKDEKQRIAASVNSARLQRLMQSLRDAPICEDEYSDTFVREWIEEIKVLDADRLIVVFNGGIEVEAAVLK